jgi:predicted patatin/cPLA2 family phospholipase
MFSKMDYKHQQKPILLTKGQSTYKKLEKEMNEAPKDYNSIKKLIETDQRSLYAPRGGNNEISIEKISNNIQSKNVKLISHHKKK